jgi:hypothetical protein
MRLRNNRPDRLIVTDVFLSRRCVSGYFPSPQCFLKDRFKLTHEMWDDRAVNGHVRTRCFGLAGNSRSTNRHAGFSIVELVVIGTYLSELVPKHIRGRAEEPLLGE